MLYPIHPKRSQEDVRKFMYTDQRVISNEQIKYDNCLVVDKRQGDDTTDIDSINENVEVLFLYGYIYSNKTDFSNFPNLKILYLYCNSEDTITGIEQISELYLINTTFKNIPYYKNLDYFFIRTSQAHYMSFVNMYHAIRGDLNVYNQLSHRKKVNTWTDVYDNYYHENMDVEIEKDTNLLLSVKL